MKEIIVYGKSLPQTYHSALLALSDEGEYTDCADWKTTQKEVSMTMVVENPLCEPLISKLFIGGPKDLEQYRQEMLYGVLDFEVEKGNWEYTYHQRMGDQIQFVIDELRRNPSSRRAVICIRTKEDMSSDDPACMQHMQYFIRDGKLECKILFRSNDACKAAFMNAFALIQLQKLIADELGIELGSYVHRANSFHCYEQDFNMLRGYAERIKSAEDEYDVCYDYIGNWQDLMEDSKSEIEAQINELKNR